MTTTDLSRQIGRLIEQRKPYRGQPAIFERFNILVGALREWPSAGLDHKPEIARDINIARAELAERGVQV